MHFTNWGCIAEGRASEEIKLAHQFPKSNICKGCWNVSFQDAHPWCMRFLDVKWTQWSCCWRWEPILTCRTLMAARACVWQHTWYWLVSAKELRGRSCYKSSDITLGETVFAVLTSVSFGIFLDTLSDCKALRKYLKGLSYVYDPVITWEGRISWLEAKECGEGKMGPGKSGIGGVGREIPHRSRTTSNTGLHIQTRLHF